MNRRNATRGGLIALALGVAFAGVIAAPQLARGQSAPIQDGKLAFVVSDISFGLTDSTDAEAMCPQGLSRNLARDYTNTPDGQRREGESDEAYERRLSGAVRTLLTASCTDPTIGGADPNMHPMAAQVASYGLDLDGQNSTARGRPAAGTCAHDDFPGVDGARGIDNQFLRAVGCTRTFQRGGQANDFDTEMLTGSWGILIALEGVDDLRNDRDVIVKFYVNNDPIQLSPNREPLRNATYAFRQDPHYQATTRGRITDGVLTTEPVDATSRYVVAGMHLDRALRDARLRMSITSDGSMEGILAGYAPVENAYDVAFGFRGARDASGQPARYGAFAAAGYAGTAGHTCNGAYYLIQQMADGHRDPQTGRCTSISTQYRVRAIPAFVVDAATSSVNADLE